LNQTFEGLKFTSTTFKIIKKKKFESDLWGIEITPRKLSVDNPLEFESDLWGIEIQNMNLTD